MEFEKRLELFSDPIFLSSLSLCNRAHVNLYYPPHGVKINHEKEERERLRPTPYKNFLICKEILYLPSVTIAFYDRAKIGWESRKSCWIKENSLFWDVCSTSSSSKQAASLIYCQISGWVLFLLQVTAMYRGTCLTVFL